MIAADGTLYVDNSTLKSLVCSTQGLVRYGFGLTSPEERATLKSGSAGHEAMAHYFRTGDAEGALALYRDQYSAWAEDNVPPNDRLAYANTANIIGAWFDKYPYAMLPFGLDPELIEIGFSFPLTEGDNCVCGDNKQWHHGAGDCERTGCGCPAYCPVVFVGRMDGIVTSPDDGAWYVLEHKFTGRITPTWIKGFRMDSQLSGYLWAAQQHTGRCVLGAYLNAVEFSRLPTSERKCPRHAVSYEECGLLHMENQLLRVTRTPEQIEEWRRTALHLANRYRLLLMRYPRIEMVHKVRMQGTFHNACTWCAFYDWCSVGRPLDLVKSMLVYEPWEPYAHALGGHNTGKLP